MKKKFLFLGAALLLLALALAACQSTPGPAAETAAAPGQQPEVTQPPCPTSAPCPDCPTCPESVVQNVPFEEAWAASPHADAEAEAFVHWNEEDPQEVPASCAKCHSTPGYLDFLGVDGTPAGEVNNPAPIGTVITCEACHNQATATMNSVVFPSGVEATGLGASSRCAQCHQGRASKVSVDNALTELNLTEDLDTPNAELRFINIHYYAAAATLYGSVVHGGYEYDGQAYEAKFDHVEGFDTCIGCHSPHSLEIRVEACSACHQGVGTQEDLRNIRMAGSLRDYDGDGNLDEGIAFEIEGLQEMLISAIQAYATEVAGTAIAYDAHTHPYFFIDGNSDGAVGEDEANSDNGYNAWTGRLLKAAYNYQTSLKDPGAYAHNGKYIIQLLHDSINDLNTQLGTPVDLAAASRSDAGHFNSSEEAFRHWDEDEETGGMVPADCVRCHTAPGLPMFMTNNPEGLNPPGGARFCATCGVTTLPPSSGLNCATCHNDLTTFTRFEVPQVRFPSGALLSFDDQNANLCIECHQGRESKFSVDDAIAQAGVGDDEASESLRFRNPHYFATGGTLMGTEAKGAYEFDGQEYDGRISHPDAFNTCIECHDAHALTVQTQACTACHGNEDPATYRDIAGDTNDYDGDGDVTEGIAGEVATMHETLYTAITEYGSTAGTPLQYNPGRYPYFFNDPNENGEVDEGEEAFASWTPNLLRSAYNYQWVAKDPGSFAHNGEYIMQILYDSIQNVGGDVSGMTRPAVTAAAGEGEATPTP